MMYMFLFLCKNEVDSELGISVIGGMSVSMPVSAKNTMNGKRTKDASSVKSYRSAMSAGVFFE